MTISHQELAELIREIEAEDPIDYADLPYAEDDLRLLVCDQICDLADRAEALGEEERHTVLLAVAAKLVLENLVLNVRLLRANGQAVEESAAELLARLRGKL
jgi:hypothetical protein